MFVANDNEETEEVIVIIFCDGRLRFIQRGKKRKIEIVRVSNPNYQKKKEKKKKEDQKNLFYFTRIAVLI